ncbi:hypothetical protein [Blastococcus tunisiensis]|nr:hypothetical protein [Blastococcus sp. DSM 46838]
MESDGGSMDTAAAAAELTALRADRAALAERVVQPWWYDVLLGLLVFLFLGSYATHDWWLIGGAGVLFAVGLWGLTLVYRRLTGMWVSGLRPGPTQRAMTVWFWCCVTWGGAALLDLAVGLPWLVVGASAGCAVAVVFVSRWWTRIYVAELRGEL